MAKFKLCACNLLKRSCKKHNPAAFCNHGRLIRKCKQCSKHRGRCACGKQRGMCRTHGGWLLCKCGSVQHRSRCTVCGTGSKLCKHQKRVNNCMQCLRETGSSSSSYLSSSSEVCECLIARKFCKLHGGSHLCTSCKLTTTRTKNTKCSPCRRFLDGKGPIKRQEAALKNVLDSAVERGDIPPYHSHDKQAELGLDPTLYGANRPDFLFKLNDRWVIVECDEHQHKGKTYSCERRRELELYNSAKGKPLVVVRYNPDAFKTGTKTAKVNHSNTSTANRHAAVLKAVRSAIERPPPTGVTIVKLFFDCTCKGQGATHRCGFVHKKHFVDHTGFLLANQASTAV
jgi:hypothetical protein